jgi:hypothetical protein
LSNVCLHSIESTHNNRGTVGNSVFYGGPCRGVISGTKCKSKNISICAKCTLDERPSIFITDKPIFSSERMLHKDYYRKGSVGGKKILVVGPKGLDGKTN